MPSPSFVSGTWPRTLMGFPHCPNTTRIPWTLIWPAHVKTDLSLPLICKKTGEFPTECTLKHWSKHLLWRLLSYISCTLKTLHLKIDPNTDAIYCEVCLILDREWHNILKNTERCYWGLKDCPECSLKATVAKIETTNYKNQYQLFESHYEKRHELRLPIKNKSWTCIPVTTEDLSERAWHFLSSQLKDFTEGPEDIPSHLSFKTGNYP